MLCSRKDDWYGAHTSIDKHGQFRETASLGKRSPHEATCPRIASEFSEKDAACLPITIFPLAESSSNQVLLCVAPDPDRPLSQSDLFLPNCGAPSRPLMAALHEHTQIDRGCSWSVRSRRHYTTLLSRTRATAFGDEFAAPVPPLTSSNWLFSFSGRVVATRRDQASLTVASVIWVFVTRKAKELGTFNSGEQDDNRYRTPNLHRRRGLDGGHREHKRACSGQFTFSRHSTIRS
jgi:hypothetical protein